MAGPRRINWRACAVALAGAVPVQRLHPETLAWAETSPTTEKWIVAFSGGADSLALLLLLWAHWPKRRRKLVAAHFNHRLRGAAAVADARFCERVCDALGVRFFTARWDQARPAKPSEAVARAARHAFLEKLQRRLRTRAIWFGHHRDDVAETMFMRLARGSGTGGLAAPRPVQTLRDGPVHLRPLLTLGKAAIVAALRDARAPWREDATNMAGDFFRNRIRRSVVPAWREAAGERDALAGAALSRDRLAEDDAALDAWLAMLKPITARGELSLRRLGGKPRGLARRALHDWLSRNDCGQTLSRQAFERLLDDMMSARRTRHSLDASHFAEIGPRVMKVTSAAGKLSV